MDDTSNGAGAVAITGASTGIGKATALHLASQGRRVFAGVRKPTDGEALVAEGGERIVPWLIDVADGASIARAVAELEARLDGARLVGLVNNAGIGLGGPQEYVPLDDWRRQFEVNVFGLVDLTQKLVPALVRTRGRVVNISSIGGRVATPCMAPYCASKYAVEGLTMALRLELHALGVWAASVQPGMVRTEIWKKADTQLVDQKSALPAEAHTRYADTIAALERFVATGSRKGVAPLAVARAIEHALFAARPRARYLVGPDAHAIALLQWLLPDRAFEWVLRKAM
jgi:NAD(P)-dependent dehydrogenase (short-subunit alcohol dehydrogenase family)